VNSGQDAADARKNCIYGDSWFAGVKTAELIATKSGHCFVGPVKTNMGGFPKDELQKIMNNWPAGASICFEAEDANGSNLGLTAVGYKYHKKGSIHFVMTNNAGSTTPGYA
jgi:hypothetical protein